MKYINLAKAVFKNFFLISFLYWPLMRYQFGLYDAATPDFWLIVIFLFIDQVSDHQWPLFLIALLLDNLYNLPLGSNYIALIIAIYIYKIISLKLASSSPLSKFIDFSIFAFIIYLIRIFIAIWQGTDLQIWFETLFQYLFTILTFPIIDLLKKRFMNNAKQ